MEPASGVRCQDEPAEEAYCTLQPSSDTVFSPVLRSSMKSLRRVAPELPPPPYTWLTTTCAAAVPATPQPVHSTSAHAAMRPVVRFIPGSPLWSPAAPCPSRAWLALSQAGKSVPGSWARGMSAV